MRVSSRLAAISVLAAVLAGPASSATYMVNTMGSWENVVGGSNLNGEGTSQISWGIPEGNGGQSGFTFGAGFFVPNVSVGQEFSFGTFTHRNFRINGDSISEADLNLTFTVLGVGTFNTLLKFTHDETENDDVPCAYADGPNQNGCADRVSVLTDYDASDAFTIDGTEYYFSFNGFQSGTETVVELLTAEQLATSVSLRGVLRERPVVVEPTPVPLPASWLALLAAVGGLAMIRRRT